MTVLGLVPGMPTAAFLIFAAPLYFAAWRLQQKADGRSYTEVEALTEKISQEPAALVWDDLPFIDRISVELGFRLVYLADKDQGESLLQTLRGVRKTLSEQSGFLLPEVRVRDNLQRLNRSANLLTGDAGNPEKWWDGQLFDAVLLDAPCSATGILRRQPDLKWHRRDSDIATLCGLQARILDAIWPLVRPGGVLVYATC